ncbi:DUF4192 domain-containing protein [Arthrobacter sp. MDT3-44]
MSSPMSPAPDHSPSFAVTSPADILSYIPHALGFMPDESLVVLTSTARRLGATLRVDLPADEADSFGFAEGVLSFLQGDTGADGTLLVIYTKESWRRLEPPPRNGLVGTLDAVLLAAGLPVRAGWLVSPTGWRDLFCTDEECCPWPGQPLDAVLSSPLGAELIFGGSAFDASPSEAVLRVAPAVGGEDTAPGLPAVEDAQAHYAACCAGRWTAPAQFRATSAVWDAVILRPEVFEARAEPGIAGFLLASIESRAVRDFLLVSACLGSGAALEGAAVCGLLGSADAAADTSDGAAPPDGWILPDARCAGGLRSALAEVAASMAEPAAVPATAATTTAATTTAATRSPATGGGAAVLYADVLAGRHTGAIAWNRVDAMTCVLARLAAVSDGESRAAALTMSAWFEYARGRGSRAAVYLEAAERAVPGYRLARLLHELLRRGGLPAWARKRSTAWTPGPPPAPPGAA